MGKYEHICSKKARKIGLLELINSIVYNMNSDIIQGDSSVYKVHIWMYN